MSTLTTLIRAINRPDVSYALAFVERAAGKKQRRLQNRVLLSPDIELSDYTARAVLDWIDLRFRTTKPTQWKWIQHHIQKVTGRRLHVVAVRADDEAVQREFAVRFQEPSYRLLVQAEEAVRDRWGMEKDAGIVAMEISLDFRPRVPSQEALARIYGVLVRTHLPSRDVVSNPRDRPRFAWQRGTPPTHVLALDKARPERSDELMLEVENDRPTPFDATYYAGGRDSRSAWRTMIKLIDQQNVTTGTRKDLPEGQHRMRIEVTLQHEELKRIGLGSIADLARFKWQRLNGYYFSFFLPTFPALPFDACHPKCLAIRTWQSARSQRFLNAGVVGLNAMDEAWHRTKKATRKMTRGTNMQLPKPGRHGRGISGTLVRYEELTRKAIQALRHIGDRMRV